MGGTWARTSDHQHVDHRRATSRVAGLNAEGMQRLSFHDLRHTAITHLIRSGADAAQVSRFAGHSKVSTTLDLYVGEFEKRKVNDSGRRLAEVYAGAV